MIETMVVLTIIAILMAILLPVYSRALKYAYGGVCTSNLSQIHKALMMYSTDHGGGALGTASAVYPPSLWHLKLPEKVTHCQSGSAYEAMWFKYQQTDDPVLVVDTNRVAHNQAALGLYASGRVRRRRAEGEPTDPAYWQ